VIYEAFRVGFTVPLRRSRTFYRPCGAHCQRTATNKSRLERLCRLSLRSSARGDRLTPRAPQRYHAKWVCKCNAGVCIDGAYYLISYVTVDFRRSMCHQVLSHTALSIKACALRTGFCSKKTIGYGNVSSIRADHYCTRGTTRTGQGAVAMTALQIGRHQTAIACRWRVPMTMESQSLSPPASNQLLGNTPQRVTVRWLILACVARSAACVTHVARWLPSQRQLRSEATEPLQLELWIIFRMCTITSSTRKRAADGWRYPRRCSTTGRDLLPPE